METHRDHHGRRQALRFASSRANIGAKDFPMPQKTHARVGSRRLVESRTFWRFRHNCILSGSRGFISNFYSHSGEFWELGACWCPIVMKRRCYLNCGLCLPAKPNSAVAATRDTHSMTGSLALFLLRFRSPGSNRNRSGLLRKRPIPFATSPQRVQQNGQLASYRHYGSLFAALASTGRQFQSPPS